MNLFEVFQSPEEYEIVRYGSARVIGRFSIDGTPYTMEMRDTVTEDVYEGDAPFEVPPTSTIVMFYVGDGELPSAYGILGTGGAFRVMATVLRFVKDHAARIGNRHLIFTADEPSRKRLYRTMANKMAKPYQTFVDGYGDEIFIIQT